MALSLQEKLRAPEEFRANLVEIEFNKHEIERLREKNVKLRKRNEKLERVIKDNQEFFDKKKIVLEDK